MICSKCTTHFITDRGAMLLFDPRLNVHIEETDSNGLALNLEIYIVGTETCSIIYSVNDNDCERFLKEYKEYLEQI